MFRIDPKTGKPTCSIKRTRTLLLRENISRTVTPLTAALVGRTEKVTITGLHVSYTLDSQKGELRGHSKQADDSTGSAHIYHLRDKTSSGTVTPLTVTLTGTGKKVSKPGYLNSVAKRVNSDHCEADAEDSTAYIARVRTCRTK